MFNCPHKPNATLETLLAMHLQEDVRQQAALEILSGKPLDVALRHARAEVARQLQPSGFVSFDDVGEGDVPLLERVAAPEPEPLECWRSATLDDALESVCATLAAGTAALGHVRGLTQRRAQQIVERHLHRAERGNDLFLVQDGEMR